MVEQKAAVEAEAGDVRMGLVVIGRVTAVAQGVRGVAGGKFVSDGMVRPQVQGGKRVVRGRLVERGGGDWLVDDFV